MTIFLVICAVLLLLAFFPFGAEIHYNERGVTLFLRVGPIWLRVYPAKANGKKKPSSPRKASKSSSAPQKGGALAPWRVYFPLLSPAFTAVKRRVTLHTLSFHLLVAAPDPASAALVYGGANAFLGAFWAVIRENFKVTDYDLRCDVNFDLSQSVCVLEAGATLRLWQIFVIVFPLLVRFAKLTAEYNRSHPDHTRKEVTSHE